MAEEAAEMSFIRELLRSEEGPTAVEYSVMLSLILVVSLAAIQTIGQSLAADLDNTSTRLSAVLQP